MATLRLVIRVISSILYLTGGAYAMPPEATTLRDLQRLPEHEESFAPAERHSAAETRPGQANAKARDRFRASYVSQGRPRIAVFMNRELSDDVREWNVTSGVLKPQSMSETQAHSDGTWNSVERIGGTAEHAHTGRAESASRESPHERWMWQFEDGFLQPFLATSARVIDRSSIVRLAAAQSAQTGLEYANLATKKVEVDALLDHADILVELLIVSAADAPHGYEFRAIAKEVRTGRIIASVVTQDGGVDRGPTTQRWGVGDAGYQLEIIEPPLPSLNEVSQGLAQLLMAELATVWE